MNVVWVNKSFLDYRVPVYRALDRMLDHRFTIIFSERHTPQRVREKIRDALGERAVALAGERVVVRRGEAVSDFANAHVEVAYQPGLYRRICEAAPDVIIGEGFFQWTTAALACRILRGTPLVISYERTHHTERHSQWYRTMYRKAAARVAGAVCCNGTLSRDYLISLGIPAGRIVTGGMAADSEGLRQGCALIDSARRDDLKRALSLSGPVFLCVGQLVQRKGVAELLRGWECLAGRRPAGHGELLIVGDGPERARLEAYVQQRGLRTVRFAGAVPYDDMAQYYAMADVLVMPTLEDNWSLVVPEAMACGLPVLCSVYNGCWPELVRTDVNGRTFDPLDAEETASGLEYFLTHADELALFGHASRCIEADFSPEQAARAYLTACKLAFAAAGKTLRR